MMFAAFSTELAVCENILAGLREITGWTRKKGCVICAIIVFLAALTTALGFSIIPFHPFSEESTFLDFWDFIVSTNILPLGALTITIFCTNDRFGWGWDKFCEEANQGIGLKIRPFMKPIFKVFAPICIILIYIIGIMNFQWN